MIDTEKVYEVEFMQYTNCMKEAVSNNATDIADVEYIHVGKEPFLVKESDLSTYQRYGGGFRSLKYVGEIEKT